MKTKSKLIIAGFGIATIAATLVGVSTSWRPIELITLGGSNSVLPLATELGNIYEGADVVSQGGGSSAGVSNAIEGSKDIGMASRLPGIELNNDLDDINKQIDDINNQLNNPQLSTIERLDLEEKRKNLFNSKIWLNKNMKTVTIAWDGITILYKPSKDNFESSKLELTNDVVAKIYLAFSGIRTYSLKELGVVSDNEANNIVKPFARSGGADVSGTAEAFETSSNRNWKETTIYKELSEPEKLQVDNALGKGSYIGNNITQTAEANSQSWSIAKNGPVGSIVYLSAGFVNNNIDEISAAGYKIATYNNVLPTSETVSEEYQWFRPFNLMIPTGSAQPKLDFISWILDLNKNESLNSLGTPGEADTKQEKMLLELGYILLKEEQILSMFSSEFSKQDLISISEIKKYFWEEADDNDLKRSGADASAIKE